MDEREVKTSKFSSGLNIIMRLDELWKDTHRHARDGLYKMWNLDLDRIWLELSRDLKEEKTEELEGYSTIEKEFNKFDKEISDLGVISDTEKEGFKKLTPEDIKNRNNFYKILMRKQLFLARLENKLGKGTTYEDLEDEDLD